MLPFSIRFLPISILALSPFGTSIICVFPFFSSDNKEVGIFIIRDHNNVKVEDVLSDNVLSLKLL